MHLPRIMVIEYNESDWISNMMQAVMLDINKDLETIRHIRFYHTKNTSDAIKQKVTNASDVNPAVLEDMVQFKNEDEMCSLHTYGLSFGEMPVYEFIQRDSRLKEIGDKLEMMYYGYDDDAARLSVFACFDDLILSNDIFEDKFKLAQKTQ